VAVWLGRREEEGIKTDTQVERSAAQKLICTIGFMEQQELSRHGSQGKARTECNQVIIVSSARFQRMLSFEMVLCDIGYLFFRLHYSDEAL
jgi:hypothetical protein